MNFMNATMEVNIARKIKELQNPVSDESSYNLFSIGETGMDKQEFHKNIFPETEWETDSALKYINDITADNKLSIETAKLTEQTFPNSIIPVVEWETDSSGNQTFDYSPDNTLFIDTEILPAQVSFNTLQMPNSSFINIAATDPEVHASQKRGALNLQMLPLEEMQSVTSDSTGTASELEDIFEENINQASTTSSNTSGTTELKCLHPQLQQTQLMPLLQESTALPEAGGSNNWSPARELEFHDLEEVLKTLENFETFEDPGGADDLDLQLNVLLDEVDPTLYEEISDRVTKSNRLKCELNSGQRLIERKINLLLHRLQKMQVLRLCRHTTEETVGLFEYLARKVEGRVAVGSDGDSGTWKKADSRPPATSWDEEKKNPVLPSQVVALLRRLKATQDAQEFHAVAATPSASLNLRFPKTKLDVVEMQALAMISSAIPNPSIPSAIKPKEESIFTIDEKATKEMTHVVGILKATAREVQKAFDSDATESSSDEDSLDEEELIFSSARQYARDRASIIRRWDWLQLQVDDLRVKRENLRKLYKEAINTKGAVTCGLEDYLSMNSSKSNHSTSTATSPESDSGTTDEMDLPGSSRTLGYIPTKFQKRQLLQITNMHLKSKVAARPSTIKCGCQSPVQPCALCTGRPDPTAPRDPPQIMKKAERVSLLDPCYHPVLSFPEDVSHALHVENIARNPDWQTNVLECKAKSFAKRAWKGDKTAPGEHLFKRYGEPYVKRRYNKKKSVEGKENKLLSHKYSPISPANSPEKMLIDETTESSQATLEPSTETTVENDDIDIC